MPEANNTAQQGTNNAGTAVNNANNNNDNNNNNNNNNNQQSNAGQNGIDYDKIQSMIDKGVQQKENAILRSYFEQQGMSEDEVKSAIGDWKAKKQTQTQEQNNAFVQAQEQNKVLQARLTQELLNKQAFNDCLDLGVDKNTIPYVIKSADFKDAIDEKGEIKADKVREVIEKVLADVPAFKGTSKNDMGFRFGEPGESDDATEQENALRKAFGLAPKK